MTSSCTKIVPQQVNPVNQDLKQAWGTWLTELGDQVGGWEWFVTMTLKPVEPRYRKVTERSGLLYQGRTYRVLDRPGYDKPGWGSAKRAWREFIAMARPALGDLQWVRMFETQGWRGVPHIHALVGDVDHSVRRMDLVDWAWGRWGMARVLEYDPELGARFYLCKYVTKELGDIQFSEGLSLKNKSCCQGC